jgi:hypothetical protein
VAPGDAIEGYMLKNLSGIQIANREIKAAIPKARTLVK